MKPALDIGGALSIACTRCGAARGASCLAGEGRHRRPARPHAARLKAAPPIVEAHVGERDDRE